MDDDLNVPQALAVVHETVRAGNTALTEGRLEDARQALHERPRHAPRPRPERGGAGRGSGHPRNRPPSRCWWKPSSLPAPQARATKDWAASDAIRDTLKAAGVAVEDGPDGATWSLQRD